MSAFFELEGRRAAAMLDNLLIRMSEQKTNVSALTCCGNLPELICELMKLKGVSYARIKPKAVFLSDPDKYDARIRGEPLTLEKIISELPNESEWPNDGDWENLNLHKVHHLLKRTQKDIELKEAIPELNDMLSTSAFKQLSPAAKLQMLKELPFPFWIVEQFLPESELRILDKSELRYLGLESMLSNRPSNNLMILKR